MLECNIALIGLGTVGGGTYQLIQQNADLFAKREGIKINIKRILVKDLEKERDVPKELLTDTIDDIITDEQIDLVAEAMGGTDPALLYALAVLKSGKTYVTANKELVAKHWMELEKEASKTQAGLYFEPSVAGGIPIIRTITDGLQANRIESIMGIINGTTNYILSRMQDEKIGYAEALSAAQELGYAEPDPTNDVEGYDAAYKLAILTSLAFGKRVLVEDIFCDGIQNVTADDIAMAEQLGYVIKLLAIGKDHEDGKTELRVHPTMIPSTHPLAAVSGPYNAVYVQGNAVGDVMLYGRGAGDMPTASAMVSDILMALKTKTHPRYDFAVDKAASVAKDFKSSYYVRTMAADEPGMLSKIAGVFAKYGTSLESVMQQGRGYSAVPIIFVTHPTSENSLMQAIEEIRSYDEISIASIIRVED